MIQAVRWVLASLAASLTAVLALDQEHLIKLTRHQAAVAIIGVAAVAIVAPLLEALRGRTQAERLKYENDLSATLRTALVTVVTFTAIDWKEVGASVYLVKRPHWFLPREQLVRLAYERFAFATPPVPAQWQIGKGVAGRCWATRSDQSANLGLLQQQHQHDTPESWMALPQEVRLGLSLEEFRGIEPKDGEIARPISDGARLLGVISLHAPSDSYTQLQAHAAWTAIGAAADSIRRYLAP